MTQQPPEIAELIAALDDAILLWERVESAREAVRAKRWVEAVDDAEREELAQWCDEQASDRPRKSVNRSFLERIARALRAGKAQDSQGAGSTVALSAPQGVNPTTASPVSTDSGPVSGEENGAVMQTGLADDPKVEAERRSERIDECKTSPSSPTREGLPASVSDDRDGTTSASRSASTRYVNPHNDRYLDAEAPHDRDALHGNAAQAAPAQAGGALTDELLAAARSHVMTDEERAAQRESWVRGEMAMGTDADEAKYRAQMRATRAAGLGDEATRNDARASEAADVHPQSGGAEAGATEPSDEELIAKWRSSKERHYDATAEDRASMRLGDALAARLAERGRECRALRREIEGGA